MKENEIGNDTKMQINTILNNLQSRAFSNSNNSYNEDFINSKVKNLDVNVFKSFGIDNRESKEIKNINDEKRNSYTKMQKYPSARINYSKTDENSSINYYYEYRNLNNYNDDNLYNNSINISYSDIKKIIRNEFSDLILPYQKQIYNLNNMIQEKIDNSEARLKAIIDSKSLDNINETVKMINICIKDNKTINNYGNNNNNGSNNMENKLSLIVKNQYDNKFDIMERQIKSMNSLLKTFQKTFDSNMLDFIKHNKMKKDEEKKNYIEQGFFENFKKDINIEMNNLKEEQENKYKIIINQINQQINDINKIIKENNDKKNESIPNFGNENMLNDLNILRENMENITEEIFDLKNKINNEKISKSNNDGLDNLKLQEINEMKNYINSLENNINDIRDLAQGNNQSIYELKRNMNKLEQDIKYINKDLENLNNNNNNNNLEQKFIDLNNKVEDLIAKKEKEKENKNKENEVNNINKDKNNEEFNKNESIFGLTGSRRQKRNMTISQNVNVHNNINNVDLENLKAKIDYLTNENKIFISKMEENNHYFQNMKEQENKLNQLMEEINKKIKDNENRLYLLELKNYDINNNENNSELRNKINEVGKTTNNNNSFKENKNSFNSKKKDSKSSKNSDNKNNFNEDIYIDPLEESSNSKNNKISLEDKNNNEINNNRNMKNERPVNNNKDNDDTINKIMNEDKNNYKDIQNTSNKDESKDSISNILNPILEKDKGNIDNKNDNKKEDKSKSKISEDDFDDIDLEDL